MENEIITSMIITSITMYIFNVMHLKEQDYNINWATTMEYGQVS